MAKSITSFSFSRSKVALITMPNSSPMSIRQARRLLDLNGSTRTCLSKEEISQAFLRAAKKHHPDRHHSPEAMPCAERFRQALDAKELLLRHYCGGRRAAARNYTRRNGFAPGFPTRTMRVLTLKQNLMLRGIVLTAITIGTLYDEWSRKGRKSSRN